MKQQKIIAFFALVVLTACQSSKTGNAGSPGKNTNSSVKIVGAMRNVMHKGELFGTIDLDTIVNKQHLYGLGPLEYLTGEILVIDGKAYRSTVDHDTAMQVAETFSIKAPFFVYANVYSWIESHLPDSVITLPQLENYIDQVTKDTPRPFCFRVKATVDSAAIHIVNLPAGTKVSTPEQAHRGQKNYRSSGQEVDMVGFFSTEHQGVFTHHDSFVHIHLITADRKQMGHLFRLNLRPGTAKLFLPKL